MAKQKIKVSASYREITKIIIIKEIPKGIYITKAQEAFGEICKELADWDLKSITLSSHSKGEKSYHEYEIIFNRTFEYSSGVTYKIRNIFEAQDWGEITEDEL